MTVKLTIVPSPPAVAPAPDKEIFITLRKLDQKDQVLLAIVDPQGNSAPGGSLLIITLDGYYPLAGVDPAAGVAVEPNKGHRMKKLPVCPPL